MQIGYNGTGIVGKASIERVTKDAQQAAAAGFTSYWLADHPTGGFDALTALAIAGQSVAGIELGTAIVPTFPRHPMALAAQALTTAQAIGGRLTLGIGLSHATMMADLGIAFERPIRHLQEYLSILVPLLHAGEVEFRGELLSAQGKFFAADRVAELRCEVLVAALGPQALRVAGRLAAGTTLAWVGPRTIREHIVPTLNAAAEKAGRADKLRVLATLPICVTDRADELRASIDANLGSYGALPSYRAMFDREGVAGPGGVALLGSPAEVEDRINGLADAGLTDFCPTIYGLSKEEQAATLELLRTLVTH